MYENNHEGKRAYVNDLLKPLLVNAGLGIKDVQYLDEKNPVARRYPETVEIINANPEKSMSVNVSADSIRAMVCDVMKRVFGLDYAREEEPKLKDYVNL